ncbi:Arf family guanine nucleotide exchange factor SEC7 [Sporobolomyces koalae]|uniref:Arf family guanine nucleotide exchange factor SEC7 n=1 Tax=Sporobolomyces koalae TaxID=500713 RepID=UPI003175D315
MSDSGTTPAPDAVEDPSASSSSLPHVDQGPADSLDSPADLTEASSSHNPASEDVNEPTEGETAQSELGERVTFTAQASDSDAMQHSPDLETSIDHPSESRADATATQDAVVQPGAVHRDEHSTLAQDSTQQDAEGFEDVNLSRAASAAPPEDDAAAHEPRAEDRPESEPTEALTADASSTTEPVETNPATTPTSPALTSSGPSIAAPAPVTSHPATPSITSPQAESQPSNRRESQASIATVSAPGSTHLVSGILIVSSLESIAATKEAKKSKPLKDAVDQALDVIKNGSPSTPAGATTATVNPHLVFLPLRLACETKSLPLMITALDCIGKLVSYDFFVDDKSALERSLMPDTTLRDDDNESVIGGATTSIEHLPLADQITSTVCDCFSPSPAGTAASTSTSSSSSSIASQPTTPHDTLLLRLLSCLLSLILSSSLPVHQSALLKAVRTVYNVFLLGRAGTVQTVAQATLGQIVGGVFGRVKLGIPKEILEAADVGLGVEGVAMTRSASRTDLASVREEERVEPTETENEKGEESQSAEVQGDGIAASADADANAPQGEANDTTEQNGAASEQGSVATPRVSISQEDEKPKIGAGEKITTENLAKLNGNGGPAAATAQPVQSISTNDLYIKDAFLVFRALCKLSMKPLGAESERDLKSPAMRSKLLSLHLVLTVLHNHMSLFVDPNIAIVSSTSRDRTPFLTATKQYLLLALSRNAVSPVIQVFELSCEIFSRMLSGMRQKLKKEIEVLLNEIFLPILEMRTSTVRQKSLLLAAFARLAQDPQALVDIYLNYDCDRSSLDNIYERLLNVVSKLGTTHFPPTNERPGPPVVSALSTAASPFPLAATSLYDSSRFADPHFVGQPAEAHLKRQSLECLVEVLKSLVSWAGRGSVPAAAAATAAGLVPSTSMTSLTGSTRPSMSADDRRTSETDIHSVSTAPTSNGTHAHVDRRNTSGTNTPDVVPSDDPSRFENAKQRKTTLLEGIKKFNFKPKRGVAFLIETGFIRSKEPKDIARFLLNADGLDKAQIGEFLGEGDAENIAAMHAFVDYMDFNQMKFVDALRMFLQSFRLPGEAQKIDRYMLKFAERYTAGNPGVFANADTAYILAFSVILLNTDAHNPQVKKPMSKTEFIKNNRGIDDGKDLDEALLSGIYDEINANEIRMKDEVEAAGPQVAAGTGIANALATVGRDLQREAYVWQSESMVNKTENLFRTLVRGQRRGAGRATEEYYSAFHFEHVKPMFEVAWMPILAGISGPLQDSDDIDLIKLSLEGFKQAIKIVCLFDLELERNAFVTTLAKFTFLNNFGEMKPKNVEAIKTLLDVAMVDGNYLKGSWREVLTCVSQLERFQLIAQGVDSQSVPELGRKPSSNGRNRRSTVSARKTNRPTDEVAQETRSQHITITADMIFSSTPNLSGTAIVDFVQALSDVSWEEIQASGLAEQPRVFCLQKLVEICYYNMNRIRLEWSNMWTIIGEHFNQVTCHTNAKVSFLALDSLRQLAMRFLEKEELANFKFQKDFLKPFEYAMVHNNHADARDMVLQCLHQMIQARVQNLRSGWRTMFGVFAAAAKIPSERIAVQSFEIVQRVNQEHFAQIVEYGSFADLTVCITDFCKSNKFQRVSLQAIELLKSLIPMMLSCPQCPLSQAQPPAEATAIDDPMIKFWFPVLFGFYDVIMNGEDLEVRKRSLDYLFDTLKKHGQTFPEDFWNTVCKEVLFPIFAVLRSRSDVSRFSTHEDMSVWLSTTMIQALRNLVDLFTFYFDVLARLLDKLLDLLCECICQENDTLARIGTSCLQQLLENNVNKLSPERWERIVSTFVQLFKTTTAYQLFDPTLLLPSGEDSPAVEAPPSNGFVAPTPLSPTPESADAEPAVASQQPRKAVAPADRKRIFRQIIVKCVLQLLLIETTHELLQNEGVYTTIPPSELLRLMSALDDSYRFARKFNADKDLRMALWKVGFMRDLPNLLRQESTSAATLVNVLLRMYGDTQPEALQKRAEVVDVFAPLGLDVLANYVSLNPETQARNIAAWTPVCTEILQGFCRFEEEPFKAQLTRLYPLVTNTLVREGMDPTLRSAVREVFVRVGQVALGL